MEDNSVNFYSDSLLVQKPKNSDRFMMVDPTSGKTESTVTFDDLRSSFSLNYTSLSEHEVPGEFWLDADGTTKQVYQRTFVGTTPAAVNSTVNLLPGVTGFQVVRANVYIGNYVFSPTTNSSTYTYDIFVADGTLLLEVYGGSVVNKTFVATIKYIKA